MVMVMVVLVMMMMVMMVMLIMIQSVVAGLADSRDSLGVAKYFPTSGGCEQSATSHPSGVRAISLEFA